MSDNMRYEGLTLTVESVERSIEFYGGKLGLEVEVNAAPAFAMIRRGAGTIGLLALAEARKAGVTASTPAQKLGIHVEFSTDDLDSLFEELKAKGVVFPQALKGSRAAPVASGGCEWRPISNGSSPWDLDSVR